MNLGILGGVVIASAVVLAVLRTVGFRLVALTGRGLVGMLLVVGCYLLTEYLVHY